MASSGQSLLVLLVSLAVLESVSIVRHLPSVEELGDTYTNTVRRAYSLLPGLRKLRAQTPAVGRDFVSAVVSGLSEEVLGTGVMANTAVTFISWLLSSLSNLVPLEVVEYLLGRRLVQQDVMNLERLVRDVTQIYVAWTRRMA